VPWDFFAEGVHLDFHIERLAFARREIEEAVGVNELHEGRLRAGGLFAHGVLSQFLLLGGDERDIQRHGD